MDISLDMEPEHTDPTSPSGAPLTLVFRKRARTPDDTDSNSSKRRPPADHNQQSIDAEATDDTGGESMEESEEDEDPSTPEAPTEVLMEEAKCVLQRRGRGGPLRTDGAHSGFEWSWEDSKDRPWTLNLCIPASYHWIHRSTRRSSEGQLSPEHAIDLLATVLESLQIGKCRSGHFDTINGNQQPPFPHEASQFMKQTADAWYASHADPDLSCNAEYLASRRKRLQEGFELVGVLPQFSFKVDTGSTGIYFNRFRALNAPVHEARTRLPAARETAWVELPTAITTGHPCQISLSPTSEVVFHYDPKEGLVSLDFELLLELCAGTTRTLPKDDDRLNEYGDALHRRFNQDGDVRLVKALRRMQREGADFPTSTADRDARNYLQSVALETAREVFDRQRPLMNDCSQMLGYPKQRTRVSVVSKHLRTRPMGDAEVMDEALICLDELVNEDTYGVQASAVIDSTLTALAQLGSIPRHGATNARWSTLLRKSVETFDRGFGEYYRRPHDSSTPVAMPEGETDPRCRATAKVISTIVPPRSRQRSPSPDGSLVSHCIEVQAYLRPKHSTDEDFSDQAGLQTYVPIGRTRLVEEGMADSGRVSSAGAFASIPDKQELRRRYEEHRASLRE
jgi:hypothetical protein